MTPRSATSTEKRRSFWQFTAAEARAHALLVAVVLWVVAIGIVCLGTTDRDPFGQLKWTDFVHFYTLGHLARNGPVSELYDFEALHRRQVALVPASAPERYLPAYPPQIALVFAPLGNLPYHLAAALWALVSFAVYGVTLWWAQRRVRPAVTDSALLVAAAAAFPPFWSLILNGQTTAVPMLAFSAAALALAQDRKVLAGAALGLLLVKPQFGLMLAVVVLVCREWSMLAGLLMSALFQSVLVVGLLGSSVVVDYLSLVPRLAAMQGALEPSAEQMHSLAAVTRLLPDPLSTIVWLAACAWVSWLTVRLWKSERPLTVRMAALVIGSVLVNPHVNVYDVAVMAVPLVWLSGWFENRTGEAYELRHQWRLAVYAFYLLLLAPTARVIALQLSPFVMLWFLYLLRNTARALSKPEDAPFRVDEPSGHVTVAAQRPGHR